MLAWCWSAGFLLRVGGLLVAVLSHIMIVRIVLHFSY
jgi:hypothetical protein